MTALVLRARAGGRAVPFLLAAVALALLLVPRPAVAAVRRGETVTIGPNETVNEDLYAVGQTVTMQGVVNGDLLVAASQANIEGTVTGDLLLATGQAHVTGQVLGSVRAASGQTEIAGHVGKDVSAVTGRLEITPSASVDHDVLVGGGNVSVKGPVKGGILGGVGQLVLASPVDREVRVDVGTLQLEKGADLRGGLNYTSDKQATIAPDARIAGTVQKQAPVQEGPRGAAAFFLRWERALFSFFVLGLVLVLLFPEYSRRTLGTLRQKPWASLGLGVATLVVTPFAAVIVMFIGVLLGGWWLGAFLLALYAIALALGVAVGGLYLGRWILDRFGKQAVHLALALLLGVALLTLVARVPVLGAVVMLAALFFGLGALLLAALRGRMKQTGMPGLPGSAPTG